MDQIQNDLLYNVLPFLQPADLARLSCASRKFKNEHDLISELVWLEHASAKWGFNARTLRTLFPKMTAAELRSLYPHSSSVIQGINSDHQDIKFDQEAMSADFLGRVGENNRSVQGNASFPSRKAQAEESTGRSSFMESMLSFANKMALDFLKECDFPDYAMDDVDEPGVVRHSVPFARFLSSGDIQFCVKPRFISYYEVQIKPPTLHHSTSASGFECVAVGLATKSFMKNKRLPGWDNESFGYHGDDGAIFHGQGRQLAEFGPRYGCGDTIGCGLNHRDNSIFFTRNGEMLGTAFTNVPCEVDLYPTVGIDTNCSVQFNFGMRPFEFDLLAYLEAVDS